MYLPLKCKAHRPISPSFQVCSHDLANAEVFLVIYVRCRYVAVASVGARGVVAH